MHVRWCPSGPFVFLPIHAAGAYEKDGTVTDHLANYAISSYTPTLSALLDHNKASQPMKASILAIIQPAAPNVSPLPGTLKELGKLTQRVAESNVELKSLVGAEASIDAVITSMTNYSVVHFACHGTQDIKEPLNSGLILQDERLTLSKLMHTRLPNAQLAFLSACETAMGDDDHPNEAVHLAAGMLAAGFKSVVATMWTIPDSAAPIIADQVYARLLKDGKMESDKVAEALHYAIQHLRAKTTNFMSWLPFIHMGV